MHPIVELQDVAGEFRHLRAEHSRAGPEGSWRRRQRERLDELERSFETLLQRWVPDTAEQQRWREHLYRGADPPPTSVTSEPPLFRGRSRLGATLVVRLANDEQQLIIDDRVVGRRPPDLPLDSPLTHGESKYHEVFDAEPEALAALMAFLDNPTTPPWGWVRELYADGLIDTNFGLTARGRRFHASRGSQGVSRRE